VNSIFVHGAQKQSH